MDNKITRAVAKLNERLAGIEPDGIARMEAAAKLDVSEWTAFGDKPTRLTLVGILDPEEALTLHQIHSRYDEVSLAERIVFLQVMQEALPVMRKLEQRLASV